MTATPNHALQRTAPAVTSAPASAVAELGVVRRIRHVSVKRTLKWIALTTALVLLVAILVLSFVQPLLPSQAYTVIATLGGRPIQAELLHPPFMPGLYYVRLPEAQAHRYASFGIAFARQSVFWPGGHYTGWFGIRYIHTDQAKGVA